MASEQDAEPRPTFITQHTDRWQLPQMTSTQELHSTTEEHLTPLVMSLTSSDAVSAPVSARCSPLVSPLVSPARPQALRATTAASTLIYGRGEQARSLDFLQKARTPARRSDTSENNLRIAVSAAHTEDSPSDPVVISEEATVSDTSDSECSPRPLLVRKKSGELVKSSLKLPPLTRTRSMPNTKNVHFDVNLERVRRFNHKERPNAVSIGLEWSSDSESDSDVESEQWSLSTPNFSGNHYRGNDGASRPIVYLETVHLGPDRQTVRGNVLVRNVSFLKHVAIRYSTDFWRSVEEVDAHYNPDSRKRDRDAGFDLFTFEFPLSRIISNPSCYTLTMFFCVRYRTDKNEYWDNNSSLNYELLFKKGDSGWPVPEENPQSGARPARSKTMGSLPSKHSGSTDDWDMDYDITRTPSEIFKSVAAETQAFKPRQGAPNPLKSRYSFGAAFCSPAQKNTKRAQRSGAGLDFKANSTGAPKAKASMDSTDYQDIISKYCFFTPNSTTPSTKPIEKAKKEKTAISTGVGIEKVKNESSPVNTGVGIEKVKNENSPINTGVGIKKVKNENSPINTGVGPASPPLDKPIISETAPLASRSR